MEACRNARRPSHSFASWSDDNGRVFAEQSDKSMRRDGKKKQAMERALKTRSCRKARAGLAKLRLRRSATRCLVRSQSSAMRSAVEQPPANAADGITSFQTMLRSATTLSSRRVFLEFNTATLIQFLRPT